MAKLQLAILVLDASGSMHGSANGTGDGPTKAWQIEDMICRPLGQPIELAQDRQKLLADAGLVAQLQTSPARRDTTDLAVIRYDTRAELLYDKVAPVTDWELSPPGTQLSPQSLDGSRYLLGGQPFDLTAGFQRNTDLAAGLKLASEVAKQWIAHEEQQGNNNMAYVTILLMSDMLHNDGHVSEPVKISGQLQQTVELDGRPQIVVAGAAFGEDADLNLMKDIATSDEFSIKTDSPRELRDFFLSSLTRQLG